MARGDSVARGATGIYFSNVISMFASTTHFIVLTNLLTTTEVGILAGIQIIAYASSTLSNFSSPQPLMTSLPIPHALSRFIPEYRGFGNSGKAIGAFRSALALVLVLVLPITGLIFFQAESIAKIVFRGEAEVFWIQLSAFEVLFFTLNQFFFAGVIGLGRSGRAGLMYSISLLTRYGLAAFLVIEGFGIPGAVVGYAVGDGLLVLLVAPLLFSNLKGQSEKVSMISVARFSFPLLVSSLVVFGVSQIDRIFALFGLGLPELGIYTVAVAAATIGAYAPNAFNTALVPVLTSMFAKNHIDDLKRMSKTYTRYVTILGTPVAAMLAALALPLTRLFGPEYSTSALPASIISMAVALTSFTAVYNAQLIASNRVRAVMIANIAGLVFFIAILTILVPISNFLGAAIARAAMTFIVAAIVTFSSNQLGYFIIDKKAVLSSIGASLAMGTVLAIISIMIGGYARQLASLLVLVPLGAMIYIGLLRVLRTFTVDDLVFVYTLLPSSFKGMTRVVAIVAGLPMKEVENRVTGQIS